MPRGGHIVNVADATSIGKPRRRNLPTCHKAAVLAMTPPWRSSTASEHFRQRHRPGPILRRRFPRQTWERIRQSSPVHYR